MGKSEADMGGLISVRFLAVYGFVDEYGDRWHWECGQIVRNPVIIEMLDGRGAPIEIIEKVRE